MGISQITTAVTVFLTGLLPAGCHKTAPQTKAAPATAVAAGSAGAANAANVKTFDGNLGEITLTNHSETCLQLDNGENFTLDPKLLDRQNVQITLTLESKNDYGKTRDFAVTQVTAKPGKPLGIALGDLNLTFTPLVVADE